MTGLARHPTDRSKQHRVIPRNGIGISQKPQALDKLIGHDLSFGLSGRPFRAGRVNQSNDRRYFAGNSQGTIGINGAGLASGPASNTAMAPRNAPVSEWVTSG